MKNELTNMITDQSLRFSGNALIRWKPTASTTTEAPAGRTLLSRNLYFAEPFRQPKSYPRQRNYYGLYYFSQTNSHVWHESLNEANMMMLLDHTETIAAIASQPMEMVFADGGRHVPDLIALHGNHRQVVYDIKPASKITATVVEQFAKTQAVCAAVGWGYQVLPGLPVQVQSNLTWLSYYKHPGFHPGAEATSRVLASLNMPAPFDATAAILRPDSLPHGRSSLFHLLWVRAVKVDITERFDATTLIERTTNDPA